MQRLLSVGLLAVLSLASCSDDPVTGDGDEPGAIQDEFDDLVPDLLRDHNVPGAAVGLILEDEVVLRKGYGFANVNFSLPVGNRTVFAVGSVSTLMTGWAVAYLEESERMSPEVPIQGYFGDWQFPESEFDHAEVTADRLLRHEGGTSLEAYPGFPVGMPLPSVEASLSGETNGAGDVRVVYEPGSRTQYSAGGMTVIQYAIEQVLAINFLTYRSLVEDNMLRPIGVERATYILSPDVGQFLATPYDENQVPLEQRRFTAHAAAGLMMDIDDAIELMQRYRDLIKGESYPVPGFNRASLSSILGVATGPEVRYELGHPVRLVGDVAVIEQRSAQSGWRAVMAIDPNRGNGIAVFTNGENGFLVADPLVCRWYEEVTGEGC